MVSKRRLSGNAGLSLIELMVAVGILSVVMASTSQMISNLLDSVRTGEFRFEAAEAYQDITQFLADPATCEKNFKGHKLTLSSGETDANKAEFITTELKDKNDTVQFSLDSRADWKIRIPKFTLANFNKVDNRAQLKIEISPLGHIFGSQTVTRNVDMYVAVESSDDPAAPDYLQIKTCSSKLPGTTAIGSMGMASASFNFVAGVNPVLKSGANIEPAIGHFGGGNYTVKFKTPLEDSEYIVIATVGNVYGDCCLVSVSSKTPSEFVLSVRSTGKNNNPSNAAINIYGAVFFGEKTDTPAPPPAYPEPDCSDAYQAGIWSAYCDVVNAGGPLPTCTPSILTDYTHPNFGYCALKNLFNP